MVSVHILQEAYKVFISNQFVQSIAKRVFILDLAMQGYPTVD